MVRSLLCLIALSMLLTACASHKAIDASGLYECRDWPASPEKPRTQKDVAEYIIDGHAAWKSCYDGIKILKEGNNA